jgi:predicted  nucleic acid-binding Zn-ribbon protein
LDESQTQWQRWKATAASEDLQRDYFELEIERDNALQRALKAETEVERLGAEITRVDEQNDGAVDALVALTFRAEQAEQRANKAEAEVERLQSERDALFAGEWEPCGEIVETQINAAARDLLRWHDEELPKIDGHLMTVQARAGCSFAGEWEPCGEIVERLRVLLSSFAGGESEGSG